MDRRVGKGRNGLSKRMEVSDRALKEKLRPFACLLVWRRKGRPLNKSQPRLELVVTPSVRVRRGSCTRPRAQRKAVRKGSSPFIQTKQGICGSDPSMAFSIVFRSNTTNLNRTPTLPARSEGSLIALPKWGSLDRSNQSFEERPNGELCEARWSSDERRTVWRRIGRANVP